MSNKKRKQQMITQRVGVDEDGSDSSGTGVQQSEYGDRAREEAALRSTGVEPQGQPFQEGLLIAPQYLVGRRDELAWLQGRLLSSESAARIALVGASGSGKTALAAVVAQKLRRAGHFPNGVVVLFCEGRRDAPAILSDILTSFHPLRRAPESAEPARLAELAHRLLDGKKTLIVLENVEPDLAVGQIVTPLGATGATLLLTARQTLPASVVPAEDARQLAPLQPDAALDLVALTLGRRHKDDLNPEERAAAEQIVAALGGHPLALRLAGACAQGDSLSALASAFNDVPKARDVPDEEQAARAVARVFAHSARGLRPKARKLFAALAAFPTEEFGRGAVLALAQGLKLAKSEEYLESLLTHAWLASMTDEALPPASDRQRLRLHPLLRSFAAKSFTRRKKMQETTFLAIATFYASYANQAPDAGRAADEANIIGALEWAHAQGRDELVAALCDGMQYYWRDRSRTRESLRYLPWGIAAAEKIASAANGAREARLRAARLALTSGVIALGMGKRDEAEPVFQANLELRREVQAYQSGGAVLAYLGEEAKARGDLDRAEHYYQQGVAWARATDDDLTQQQMLAGLDKLARLREKLAEIAAEAEAPASDKRAVARVLEAFLNTDSWDETRGVLVFAQKLLLSDTADQLLTNDMVQALRHNNQQELVALNQHRTLLRRARVIGIADAWIEFQEVLKAPPEAPPAPAAPAPPATPQARTLEEAERVLEQQINELFQAMQHEAPRGGPQHAADQTVRTQANEAPRTLEEAERDLEAQLRRLLLGEQDDTEA